MADRRPLIFFLFGAATMAALPPLVGYVVPRMMPPPVVRRAAPPDPARPVPVPADPSTAPAPVAAGPSTAAAPVPAALAPAPTAPPPVVGPQPGDQPVATDARLLVPVQGVRADQLVDTYSAARSQGRRHDAIDIAAKRGTPVLAAAAGVVLKRFQSVRGGTTLYELAPDQRTIYYYAHLDRYAAGMVEGRALRQGDLIGYVGNTGNAGPGNYHLHFEISTTADPRRYWAGTPQNPYPPLHAGISRP